MPDSTHSAETADIDDMKVEFKTRPEAVPDNEVNGAAIRELRKNADMTQKELAEEIGIHPAYLSDLEQGNRGFSEEMFTKAKDAIAKHQKKLR